MDEPGLLIAIDVLSRDSAKACRALMRSVKCLQDSATAKSLAFNKEVRTRCVTLEGDDFNPSGTLTGMSLSACHIPATFRKLFRVAEPCIAVLNQTLCSWPARAALNPHIEA